MTLKKINHNEGLQNKWSYNVLSTRLSDKSFTYFHLQMNKVQLKTLKMIEAKSVDCTEWPEVIPAWLNTCVAKYHRA